LGPRGNGCSRTSPSSAWRQKSGDLGYTNSPPDTTREMTAASRCLGHPRPRLSSPVARRRCGTGCARDSPARRGWRMTLCHSRESLSHSARKGVVTKIPREAVTSAVYFASARPAARSVAAPCVRWGARLVYARHPRPVNGYPGGFVARNDRFARPCGLEPTVARSGPAPRGREDRRAQLIGRHWSLYHHFLRAAAGLTRSGDCHHDPPDAETRV